MIVVPAAIPVTTPAALTAAIDGDPELQVPPGVPVGSPSAMVAPVHTVPAPVMVPATGVTFTVITRVVITLAMS